MRKFVLTVWVVVLGATATVPAMAADDASFVTGYENSWRGFRTFSIQFDRSVHSAWLHVTGVQNGRCARPHSYVYQMNYAEPSKETNTSGSSFGVSAGKGNVGLNAGYNNQTTVAQEKPARFEFGLWRLGLRQVKYNIVFVRNGVTRSTGWFPHNVYNNGGCVYDVGVKKSAKAPQ